MTAGATPERVGMLDVLIVGSGGREHALAWAARRSPRCGRIFTAPGNAGTEGAVPGLAADDVDAIVRFCKEEEAIDLVIVGPEAALAVGIVDRLVSEGVRAFGPTRAAAELEWSKAYAREFCDRHGIAGPRWASFTELDPALAWLRSADFPVVVKASGLASGKGVLIPADAAEAEDAVRVVLGERRFGDAGAVCVLEERLTGEEVSLLAFTDGATVVPMPPAQDHKRIGEGDRGPNTGGMGAYAPAPICPPALVDQLVRDVLAPAVRGAAAEGRPYRGVLYAGMMLTPDGPRVLEFNCRLGDPETQVLLPLLDTDLLDVIDACIDGRLAELPVRWREGVAATVVLAAAGYPGPPVAGDPIDGLEGAAALDDVVVFQAGTARDADGRVVTAGGRVLAVTGVGADVAGARARAYAGVDAIAFAGRQVRRDIGWRALARTTGGYAASGVDITAGNRAVELMKAAVASTHGPAVLAGVGSFGGVFDAGVLRRLSDPVLVASTDGVGTKVELAARAGRPHVAGHDIVNHCVDDILVQNARPLFFLDYLASSHLDPELVASVVGGMAEACRAAGCALLGGETAEMPGVYAEGAFDVAGTIMGMADRGAILPLASVAPGDALVGLASSGPHTNGYSLLRKVFAGLPLDAAPDPLDVPLVDALLAPHRSYLNVLAPVLDGQPGLVKALVHVTGGGFTENIPRVLPSGCGAVVELASWPVPPLFRLVRDASGLPVAELYRTLNMGVGMIAVVAAERAAELQAALPEETWVIGRVTDRPGVVLA